MFRYFVHLLKKACLERTYRNKLINKKGCHARTAIKRHVKTSRKGDILQAAIFDAGLEVPLSKLFSSTKDSVKQFSVEGVYALSRADSPCVGCEKTSAQHLAPICGSVFSLESLRPCGNTLSPWL